MTNTEVGYMRHRIGIILGRRHDRRAVLPRSLGLPAPAARARPVRPAFRPAGGGGSLISDHHVLLALAAVAGTALLAAILVAVPRISPLAAGLPGLLLLGWTGLYLASVRQAVDLIPLRADPFGAGFEAMLFNGVLGAAGLAMIVPMFVPSRWRTGPAAGTAAAEPEPEDQPTTQLTPIRVTTLGPIPAAPWHDPGDPDLTSG